MFQININRMVLNGTPNKMNRKIYLFIYKNRWVPKIRHIKSIPALDVHLLAVHMLRLDQLVEYQAQK